MPGPIIPLWIHAWSGSNLFNVLALVTNIQQLEAVQRRAARFVYCDYKITSSPSQMIAELGLEPLQTRRANAIQDNVWSHWHSGARLSASFDTEHQRQHPALYNPIMQDGYLPTFILPICYQTMEPIAGSHCDFHQRLMPSSCGLPVRTR